MPANVPPSLIQLASEELLAEISAITNTGGWVYDVEKGVLEWTDQTYRIYGLESGSKINPDLGVSHYLEEAKQKIKLVFTEAIQTGKSYLVELPFVDAQGNKKWVRTTGQVLKKNGSVAYIYGAFEDITEKRNLFKKQQHLDHYLETVVNHLNDAVITIDVNGYILSANFASENVFKCKISDLIGQNVSILMPPRYAALHDKYMSNYLATGNAKIMGVGRELPALRFNGEEFSMELSLTEMLRENERIFIGIVRDISDKKAAMNQIYRMAYYDSLTHLPNRSSFIKELDEITNKALLLEMDLYCAHLDIDAFSEINLIHGQAVGDRVIQHVADKITAILPNHFKLYRNIADSYFLLYQLPLSTSDTEIKVVLQKTEERIRTAFLQDIQIDDVTISLSLSMVSALLPAHEAKTDNLIQLLEFSANKRHRHKETSFLDVSTKLLYEKQAHIRRSMLTGLEQGEFYLELQPQYSLTPAPVASEALLRWNSKEFGQLPPDEFIPLAEETGDIIPIGDWVINEVCRLLSQIKTQHINTKIAINISAKQVVQPDFSRKLVTTTAKYDVNPHQLMLEITESTLVQNIDLVRRQMESLSLEGFCFSIDDFGTGYSSLRYLKELPLHELKIDRYFVNEITSANKEVPIINTILEMAKALGVQTVAEGIENQEQFQYLAQRGCNYFQGFYLSKPLPIEKWLPLFNKNQAILNTY